ncbi:MAG: perosamine synthetase [Herpetosiphonaceae bacterium]|nr:MAG: perosamine synthetase [Herpetosiphonaceae bacterium]
MIRLTIPSIEEDDLQAVCNILATGYLVQGPQVAAFEQAIAEYVGARYAIAVCNCTAALQLALLALDVGPGDKVAVTTYSWPATGNVIALCGAQPIFIDIDPVTYNMDPQALERILEQTSVKAIVPVHTFGGMADMRRICAVADRYGVPVVEDAACALGAELEGCRAGVWGIIGCFSFHPRKAITTGEGGMIVTNNDILARRLRILRNHGINPDAPDPDFIAPGYNLRLTEFQAALGLSQMKKVERIIKKRQALAAHYNKLLERSCLTSPRSLAGSRHVYQSYVALLPPEAVPHRSAIISALRQCGIEITIGTYHMPLTTYFRTLYGFQPGDFPITDEIAARSISLPLYETLQNEQQEHLIWTLIQEIEKHGSTSLNS